MSEACPIKGSVGMLFQENVEFQAIWDSFWCLLDSMLIQAHSQPSTKGSWLKCKAGNYKCACPRQKKFASLPVATLGHKTLNCMFSCSRQQFSNFLNSCLVLWYWFHCENCLQVGLNDCKCGSDQVHEMTYYTVHYPVFKTFVSTYCSIISLCNISTRVFQCTYIGRWFITVE